MTGSPASPRSSTRTSFATWAKSATSPISCTLPATGREAGDCDHRRRPELEVVGEAATGREAVRLARQLRPDVIVMDVRMPELDGIEAPAS